MKHISNETIIKPNMQAVLSILNEGRWFSALPDDVKAEIVPALVRRKLVKDEVLCRQGDATRGLYVLLSGQCKTTAMGSDGQQILMALSRRGDWGGFLSVLDGGPYSFSVTASRATEIAFLPNAAIKKIFMGDVARYKMLVAPKLSIMRYTYNFIVEKSNRAPLRVVSQRILDLSRWAYLEETDHQLAIDNISQDDIASATQLSRPTVNKTLKELSDMNLIKAGYGKIHLIDIQGLKNIASGSTSSK
jgi:CRP/FNR family transcriptional regulator, cyclic AMP receptor protein